MEPGSDTGGALALRWAADLIGLSLIWFVFGPAVAGTIGLGWGSFGLGVVAGRLSVALGFAFLGGAGVLAARATGPLGGRGWLMCGVALAGVGAAAALATPFVAVVTAVLSPVTALMVSTGLASLPPRVGGARPRTWWRVSLAVQLTALISAAALIAVGPGRLGFHRPPVLGSGVNLAVGGQPWLADSHLADLLVYGLIVLAVADLVLILTAVTLTRRWAQGQLDAARPIDPGGPPLGGAPSTARGSLPPPPTLAMSVVTKDPPWDPTETDAVWDTVSPRPDEDPLRP